jgi:xanthine/CO dehydrogenase XdhC/CoxF family maturation factor
VVSMNDPEDILGAAAAWLAQGEPAVALATVVRSWGSSPRPPGSQLAVTADGRMAGSVSSGCVEGAVAEAALETLATGRPQLLTYGVTDERAWEVGLTCGGTLTVFVERVGAPL